MLSVGNGQRYLTGGGAEIEMPDGPSIFETTGPWEDFSTPSRDLRLLIAIDVVTRFPARVARRPERFAMPAGESPKAVEAELEAMLARELEARRFAYTRSDGSAFELKLADVVKREGALEMAYDPNDCVEVTMGGRARQRRDEAVPASRVVSPGARDAESTARGSTRARARLATRMWRFFAAHPRAPRIV